MKKINLPLWSSIGSLLGALLSSGGGVLALAYAALGGGTGLAASIAVFTKVFGPFRDFLVIASLILLGIAHYYYWRRWQPPGITPTKVILWVSTALTSVLISVFYIWGTLLAWIFGSGGRTIMNLLSALWSKVFKKEPLPTLGAQNNLVRDVLNVTDMTGEGCEKRVRSALLKVKGVVRANASYTRGVAEVEYIEGGASLEEMIQALNACGFSASLRRSGKRT